MLASGSTYESVCTALEEVGASNEAALAEIRERSDPIKEAMKNAHQPPFPPEHVFRTVPF